MIDDDREKNDHADGHLLPERLDVEQHEAVAHDRNDEDAAERAGDAAGTAHERRPADHGGGNGVEQIGGAEVAVAGVETRMETEAVDVAVAVARKLCSELIAAEPLTEITALVSDCFRHLVSTPHIVVRINDQLYDAAREQIERMARQNGFAGQLVILAEPDIETGDCRIEWADGGVVLERAAIDAKIDELVRRYMTSRNSTGNS